MNIRSKELRKAVQETKAKEEERLRELKIEELEKAVEPYLIGEFSYKIRVEFELGYTELLYNFSDEKFGSDYLDCDYFTDGTIPNKFYFWVVYSSRQNEEQINCLLNNIKEHLEPILSAMYTKIDTACIDQMEEFTISGECPKKLLQEYNNRYKTNKKKKVKKEYKPVVKIR